jgi:DNA replication and repair protein RecF
MVLKRIKLISFRNYQALDLDLKDGVTVLVGDNAQGKTNIIEAIFLCATTRSHRTMHDREMIKWDASIGYARVEFESKGVKRKIEMRLSKEANKQIKLNGSPVARAGDMMGLLNAVIFSPEDLKLVIAGPSERRRFMDISISRLDKGYFYKLVTFNRVLQQRNALLREIACGRNNKNELSVWNEQCASAAAEIVKKRSLFIEAIAGYTQWIHKNIADEALKLTYKPSAATGILEILERTQDDDIRRGVTSIGPHHDDLIIKADGVDIRAFGSQGQKRTAALSLNLAEVEFLRHETGEAPVLLLDDVLSELDARRQAALLGYIDSCQTILTCTSLEGLEKLEDMHIYKVRNACVERVDMR